MSFKTKEFAGIVIPATARESVINNALTSLCYYLRDSQKLKGTVAYAEVAKALFGSEDITAPQTVSLFETLAADGIDKGVAALLAQLPSIEFDNESNKWEVEVLLQRLSTPALSEYTDPEKIVTNIVNAKIVLAANGVTLSDVNALANSLSIAINDDSQMTEDGAELESFVEKPEEDDFLEPFRPGQ